MTTKKTQSRQPSRAAKKTRAKAQPPKKYAAALEAKAQQRRRRKGDYRPGDGYPTVDEAKALILEYHKKRGDRVKSVQHRARGFLVVYERYVVGHDVNGDPVWRGFSKYGVAETIHSWDTARWIRDKLRGVPETEQMREIKRYIAEKKRSRK